MAKSSDELLREAMKKAYHALLRWQARVVAK